MIHTVRFLMAFLIMTISPAVMCPDGVSQMEGIVRKKMEQGQIPGLAVVVVKEGSVILSKGYGYADLNKKIPVTNDTLFELGSTTKAFTAFALLQLVEMGKVDLSDPVEKYLPWFYVTYLGGSEVIRIRDCLYHTTGMPIDTLTLISPGFGEMALEETIRKLQGASLDFKPSIRFQYATINYDILGLIIQTVAGQTYESYMKEVVLEPLGLKHTFAASDGTGGIPNMSVGYKLGYLRVAPFFPPFYPGNIPAGYLIANIQDVAQWILYQIQGGSCRDEIFLKTHVPDGNTPPSMPDARYAAGWFVFNKEEGRIFSHAGNNPTFSSYFSFSPDLKFGVAVLANLNSGYTKEIGQALLSCLVGQELGERQGDFLQRIDQIATLSLAVTIPLFLYLLYSFIRAVADAYHGERILTSKGKYVSVVGACVLIGVLTCSFYSLPRLLFNGVSWGEATVWGPSSFFLSICSLYSSLALGVVYRQFVFLFPKTACRLS